MKHSFIIPIWILLTGLTSGLSPDSPRPYFHVTEQNSRFCLEIKPGKDDNSAKISCVALEWNDEIERTLIWEAVTEYPFPGKVQLSRDGRYMVCAYLPSSGVKREDLDKWTFLRFFRDGKLISEIDLGTFIDVKSVKASPHDILGYQILDYQNGDAMSLTRVKELKLAGDESLQIGHLADDEDLLKINTAPSGLKYFRLSDGKLVNQNQDSK